jgi:4-amino-4-deoxy-L-arabinose transferase-like glycosyltransferase
MSLPVLSLHSPAASGLSRRAALSRLICAAALLFLLGFFSLPPMDRDEPRFAQASKQMLETGELVAIRFQGEARLKKPVGVYWLQAAAVYSAEGLGVADARTTIWLYRLPSLLGAVATVLLTFWAALAFTTVTGAYLSALLLAATLLLGVEARLAKTDALLTATIVAEMAALARIYLAKYEPMFAPPAWRRTAAVFWIAMAIGILLKGPIAPLVPALAILALLIRDRDLSWLRALHPVIGALGCAALVAPWFVLIILKSHGSFLSEAVGKDLLGKVAGGQEMHGAPPGSYITAFFATGWPMAPFVVLASPFALMYRREPGIAFLLAWIVPAWLVFELVPTKLPHYVLPLYPALAIVVGMALSRGALEIRQIWTKMVILLLPAVALAAPVAVAIANSRFHLSLSPWLLLAGLPAFLCALGAAVFAWRGNMIAAVFAAITSSLALAAFAYLGIFARPQFDNFALSPRLVEAAKAATPGCRAPEFASVGYSEPSLVFLTRTDLLLADAQMAADFMKPASCRVAFVEQGQEAAFRSALDPALSVILADRVQGNNLNGGKRLDIGVYVRQ